ncbi:MAG TPA: ATP-binding protein [Blastocatellia bacterium]|nr:ATP-binding protein [Blastocatellia bacterium]
MDETSADGAGQSASVGPFSRRTLDLETTRRRLSVLLVEDDEEDFVLARELLSETGSTIDLEWAPSYDAGIQAILRGHHDVCLVDYRLGARTGLELLRETAGSGFKTPMILLTGQGDREVDVEAMRAGASDYLVKAQMTPALLERTIRYAVDRARTLQALRRSEERFRFLIEKAHDIITILDTDGLMLYVSPSVERVLGYQQAELVGKNIVYFVHPDDISRVVESFTRMGEVTGSGAPVEYRFLHKDGSWRFLESVANNLLQDPVVAGVVVNSRDISARKQLQEQLIQSEKMAALGQLVAGVAHELNNPLTSVIGYAQLLLADPQIRPEQKERVDLIYREAERTRRIVNNLLSFARQHKPSRTAADLNDLIGRTLELRAYDMRVNNIAVHQNLREIPRVLADEHQIQQVLLNIIMNAEQAIRSSKKSGSLTVETGSASMDGREEVTVRIADDGPGIKPDHLTRIFDPFFTTKPVGQGTGLGLSISYGIVKEHTGRIWAESTPGYGTSFFIQLPAYAGQAVHRG